MRQRIADLIFDRIKHGDNAHQAWLHEESRVLAVKIEQTILAALQSPEMVEDVEVAVAEAYVCIARGTTYEDVSEILTKAALAAVAQRLGE